MPDEHTQKRIADYGGVTVEWLLHGEGAPAQQLLEVNPERIPAGPLRPLETGLIIQVATLIEETLKARHLKLPPDQKGRLIGLLYERCRENREPPTRHLVEKYLLLAD